MMITLFISLTEALCCFVGLHGADADNRELGERPRDAAAMRWSARLDYLCVYL